MIRTLPLPPIYYHYFLTIEPALTLIAAAYSICLTSTYFNSLIPSSDLYPAPTEFHPATSMAIRQLGSCYFLLGLLATFLLRTLNDQLAAQPVILERIMSTYLTCLATADIIHVLLTALDLGWDRALDLIDLTSWNLLIFGNVAITVLLFIGRMCWSAKMGRITVPTKSKAN
jgi:hypothetical protein